MKKFLKLLLDYLKKSDTFLLVLCLISSIYGAVLISSAIRYTGSYGPLYVQIGAIVLGIFMYLLFSIVDVDIIAEKWKVLTVLGLLLILSLRWLGSDSGGNRAWIRFLGIGIQPAEIVKIIFIVSIAHLIVKFKEQGRLDHPVSVILLLIIFVIHFVLIIAVSNDTGSALVYMFIFIVMLFSAGLKLYWFLGAGAALALIAPYIWYYFLNSTHRNRILVMFNPVEIDPTGQGVTWQTNLSKLALSSGRIFGTGLYKGVHTQSGTLPSQSSDFIFSVAGEEFGIIGCIIIIILLLSITVHCVHIGIKSQNKLGALICIGIAAMIAFQTFENVGMCIGVAPVIGLTLPFFSYGGSSIVTLFAAMGIVSGIKMKPKPVMFLR